MGLFSKITRDRDKKKSDKGKPNTPDHVNTAGSGTAEAKAPLNYAGVTSQDASNRFTLPHNAASSTSPGWGTPLDGGSDTGPSKPLPARLNSNITNPLTQGPGWYSNTLPALSSSSEVIEPQREPRFNTSNHKSYGFSGPSLTHQRVENEPYKRNGSRVSEEENLVKAAIQTQRGIVSKSTDIPKTEKEARTHIEAIRNEKRSNYGGRNAKDLDAALEL